MPSFSQHTAQASSHWCNGSCSGVVAVGTSSGGMKALQTLLSQLSPEFSWPLLVVHHLHPQHPTHLPEILRRSSRLIIQLATAGDRPQAGVVYLAPPDHHLILQADHSLTLTEEPKVHFSRPAIDVLFESVAKVLGQRAIAVILTGANTDGAEGIRSIKAYGGHTLAEQPRTAHSARMPAAAIQTGAVDEVLPLEAIADRLMQLVPTQA